MTLTDKLKRAAVATGIIALIGAPVWLSYLPKQDPNGAKIPVPALYEPQPPKKETAKKPTAQKPIPEEGRIPFSTYQDWSYLFPIRDATVALLDKEDYGIPHMKEVIRDTEKYPNAARDFIRNQIETYEAWDTRKDLRDAIKDKVRAQMTENDGAKGYDLFMSDVKQGLRYHSEPWCTDQHRFSVEGKGIHTSNYVTPRTSLASLEDISVTPCEFKFTFILDSKDRVVQGDYIENPSKHTEKGQITDDKLPFVIWRATFRPVENGYFQESAGYYTPNSGPQKEPLVYPVKALGEFGSGRHITDVARGLLGALRDQR